MGRSALSCAMAILRWLPCFAFAMVLACSETQAPPLPLVGEGPHLTAIVTGSENCPPDPQGPQAGSGGLCGPTEDLCPSCDGLFVYGWDDTQCYGLPVWSMWDIDYDGVDNACENAVAASFAPELVLAHDCNWDYSLDRMGGEYLFAVERRVDAIGSYLRVVYLHAYYIDCGPPLDSKCFISACDPHSGDSEFTIIDFRYDAASTHWVAQQVFLSAHCPFSAANWNCRWYARGAFAWVGGQRYGAPIVWVSEGKHANYPSASACEEGGAYNSDSCEFNDSSRRIPIVYTQQNVGSRIERLQDCMAPFWGSPLTDPSTQECMWRTHGVQRFNGWQSAVYGPPPQRYGDILLTYAGF